MRTCCLFLALVVGCKEPIEVSQPRARTLTSLREWEAHIKVSYEMGFRIDEKTTLQEAVDFLRDKIMLPEGIAGRMVIDGWDRPLQWSTTETDKDIQIKLLSLGPDGISQDGGGDDFFMLTTVPKNRDWKNISFRFRRGI